MSGDKIERQDINIKVLGADNSVLIFKMKTNATFGKLMKVYCERLGLVMNEVRFRLDGNPVSPTDTPESLTMEDGDTIEVFRAQIGGIAL